MNKHDDAVAFAKNSMLELDTGMRVLSLTRVAELITLITGKETKNKDLIFYRGVEDKIKGHKIEIKPEFSKLVSVGDHIKTKWEWWAEVTKIDKTKQGLLVRRYNDSSNINISFRDITDYSKIRN